MARNKFKAAINHIKSTRIDEKIQRLNEAPTNNMSGVYDLSPRGQRYGELDPEKIFYANLDGSWPPGVPGTPGERKYIRPRGYWEEGPGTVPSVQHDEIIELDFSYDTQTDDPRNTKTLIDETTGRVKTELPPNSRSFILGPLVDLYFHNHGNDNRTYVGYIQKDTREFVLLGYVHGRWGNDNNGDPIRSDGFETGSARVWNGQESGFVASNPSFTFEMLQWHHERLKEGKYVKNVSFFNSGGVPIVTGGGGTGQPSGSTQGNASGTPGPGDAGNNGDADQSYGSGGNPNIGNPQNAPQGGNQNDAGGPFPDPPKPPPEDRPTPPPPEDRDDRDDRDDSLVSLFNAMKRGYQARWEAANYQAAAITGGILIGLSIKEFVAGLAVILGAVGVSDQIKRRQMGQYYHNAINGLTMQSNSDRSESDLSDAEWERQAERGRQQDAKNLEDANEKYRDAEAELSSAEASGNEEAIARAQEKVENAQKNRERVINNNTRNRQQRSKERRNRGLTQQGGQGREKGATINDRPFGESFIITESHKRILREIKQPVAEISELKPEKLKKYRPNFKGRFTAQNTPDVTASKESDKMVRAKNAAGQTWRTSDKYWGGYESQERLNVIYDHVGHGNLYWDEIVAHNQSKKGVRDRDIQEELNKHYAVLAERKMMDELGLNEQETLEAPNDPLLKRVMGKLKPQIDYPDKPSPMGYPNKPPRQRPDGYPSDYGMRDNYYNKLDQISADSMPPTGNELIDRKVDAQKTPLKKKSKKEIKAEARLIQSNWREETQLQESDWTPVAGSIANSTGTTFEYPGGSRVTVSGLGGVETTPSTVTVNQFGDIFDVPGPNYSQLGLQGYAPPLGNVNRRRDYEDVNPRLDASQEFAQNVNSDVFMNARVDDGTLIAQVIDGEKLLPQRVQDILKKGRNKPARGGPNAIDRELLDNYLKPEVQDVLQQRPELHDRYLNQMYGGSGGGYVPGGGMINPTAATSALASAIRKLGDSIAKDRGVKDAKDVFDYYMKWAENPNGNPVNLTNKISPKGQAYLQKLAGDPSVQGLTGLNKAAALNSLYQQDLENDRIPLGLRNILGMPDMNKGDGFNVDKNGKVTFSKAYDFTNYSDIGGTDIQTGLPAMGYALSQGIGKHLGIPFIGKESPTMNININVAAPSANANSVGQRGSDGGMTDAQIKSAQDKVNADRKAGKMSDIRGSEANRPYTFDKKTGEPQYTGMTREKYTERDNEIGAKWADKMWPLQKKLNDNPACIAADKCTGTKAELYRMSELMTQELEDLYNEYERQTSEFQKAQEDWFAQQDAENKARQDALDEIDNEKDPYSDLIADLGELLEKLRREGKLIKRWEIVGPGEEGYVDTTNMANAIGYNRRPIYTARAEELMGQLGAAQDAQLAWMNAQQKKREAAEKANYKGGQGGLPLGSTTLRGGGARQPTAPENKSQSAALARQAASARFNPQQRRKRGMKESTTWSKLKKHR